MVNKVAFINGKGGCGKTTSIFHVAGVLADSKKKVLVIDLDKQRNASTTLLMNSEMPGKTVYDFLKGTCEAKEAVGKALFQSRGNAKPKYFGVDVMVASVELENEENLTKDIDIEEKLSKYIEEEGYDWVLVDMPPSNFRLNEICFSQIVDFVIVPFSSDVFSVNGYGDLIDMVNEAREVNPNLNILGIYLSRYMENCAVDKFIKEQLEEFGDIFIDVQIPLLSDLREAVMFGRPISYYKMFSKSRSAYERLVKAMEKRIADFR